MSIIVANNLLYKDILIIRGSQIDIDNKYSASVETSSPELQVLFESCRSIVNY